MTLQTLRQTLHNPPQPSTVRKRLDVERLLQWAYAEERVHEWRGGRSFFEALGGGETNAAAVMRHLALGAVVDGGGAVAVAPAAPHADVLAVHELVGMLDRDLRRIVIWCAIRGTRPDAYVGIQPRCVPVLTPAGNPSVEYARPAKREGAVLCHVTYDPSPVEILEARVTYTHWHGALEWLATALVGRLERYEATGPVAPAEPWALDRGAES